MLPACTHASMHAPCMQAGKQILECYVHAPQTYPPSYNQYFIFGVLDFTGNPKRHRCQIYGFQINIVGWWEECNNAVSEYHFVGG